MIQLDDYDKTIVPETLDECKLVALLEWHNATYDIGSRDPKTAALHRWLGKLTECKVAMHLHKVGFGFKHAVRAGKAFADSGADLQLDDAHGSICLQVKFTRSKQKKLFFTDGKHQTAEQRLQKLCSFPGAIIAVHEDQNGKRRCWLGNGRDVANGYAICKAPAGYELKLEDCFQEQHDFSHDGLMEAFKRLADGHL